MDFQPNQVSNQSSTFDIKIIMIVILVLITAGILYLRSKDKNDCETNINKNIEQINSIQQKLSDLETRYKSSLENINELELKNTNDLTSFNNYKTELIKKSEKYLDNILKEMENLASKDALTVNELNKIKELNISLITLVLTIKSLFPEEFKNINDPENSSELKTIITSYSIDNARISRVKNLIQNKIDPLIDYSTKIVVSSDKPDEIKILFSVLSKGIVNKLFPTLCEEFNITTNYLIFGYNNNRNSISISPAQFKQYLELELKKRPILREEVMQIVKQLSREISTGLQRNFGDASKMSNEFKDDINKIFNYFIGKIFSGFVVKGKILGTSLYNISSNEVYVENTGKIVKSPFEEYYEVLEIETPSNDIANVNIDYLINFYTNLQNFICTPKNIGETNLLIESVYDKVGINL